MKMKRIKEEVRKNEMVKKMKTKNNKEKIDELAYTLVSTAYLVTGILCLLTGFILPSYAFFLIVIGLLMFIMASLIIIVGNNHINKEGEINEN